MFSSVCIWLCYVGLTYSYSTSDPLHLTPYLDKGDIETALQLSRVRDPKNIIPKSYAGFITADKTLGNHLFFWFFPAISQPMTPLLVWLNGGPSITSMLGLLWENGPIRVMKDEAGSVTIKRWTKSWAESLAMLYIDNPVGSGYSYSDSGEDGYKTTADGYTQDLYSFIKQFYILFPEYLKQELYIGGQSFAGKYVSNLAFHIHTEIKSLKSSLPLTGIYLGGPYFDPFTQLPAQGYFTYSTGALSHAQFTRHREALKRILEPNFKSKNNLNRFIEARDGVPITWDNYKQGNIGRPDLVLVYQCMNSNYIRMVVHSGLNSTFNAFSDKVFERFQSDLFISTKDRLAELMDNYKVLIFTGDYDANVSPAMVEAVLLSTPWSLQSQYNESSRTEWKDWGILRGYYTKIGNFCRVTVHQAGHQTPHDQPDATRDMILHFVKCGCVI